MKRLNAYQSAAETTAAVETSFLHSNSSNMVLNVTNDARVEQKRYWLTVIDIYSQTQLTMLSYDSLLHVGMHLSLLWPTLYIVVAMP